MCDDGLAAIETIDFMNKTAVFMKLLDVCGGLRNCVRNRTDRVCHRWTWIDWIHLMFKTDREGMLSVRVVRNLISFRCHRMNVSVFVS